MIMSWILLINIKIDIYLHPPYTIANLLLPHYVTNYELLLLWSKKAQDISTKTLQMRKFLRN